MNETGTLVERLREWADAIAESSEHELALLPREAADELSRLTTELAEERRIVDRVWKALDIEVYEQAKPYAIDEHVSHLKSALAAKSAELELAVHANEAQSIYRKQAEAALAEAQRDRQGEPRTVKTAAADMVLVPREPTEEMIVAASRWLSAFHHQRAADKRGSIAEAYKSMLSAAPKE